MDYQNQLKAFVNHFKKAESKKSEHKIGVEFEHFILDKDLNAVPYYGENGVEKILYDLAENNWEKEYERNHLVALKSDNKAITLEPGAQLELSINPFSQIKKIEDIYLNFLEEIKKILANYNYKLAVLGYQPKTSINDIKMLPKKRYDFMYKYFKNKGRYAHNMMKGTASLQMSIDYKNEKDYIKKMRVGYFLSPLIYYLFDNTPFFEGKTSSRESVRAEIWQNCDNQRSGLINGIFDREFGYREYAEYLLYVPPIFKKKNNKLIYTAEKKAKDVMDSNKKEEIEHFISMVFPDVRTKKYIELRAADALPYPYNLGLVAFLKGLFYSKDNLNYLYKKSLEYNQSEFKDFKDKIIYKEKLKKRSNLIENLIERSKSKLNDKEENYLDYVEEIFYDHQKMKFKTLNKFNSKKNNKKEALNWCVLN